MPNILSFQNNFEKYGMFELSLTLFLDWSCQRATKNLTQLESEKKKKKELTLPNIYGLS